jgi:hypothetical protein
MQADQVKKNSVPGNTLLAALLVEDRDVTQ